MAIKQRALKKLHTTKNHILRVMSTGSKAALDYVCRDLAETRELYREGLSPQNYTAYGEIFDGLILAVRTMTETGEENFQEDVFVLCQELLEHLEKETAKETRFKKEIFFLPYKASMWDSLESVWKAACEDKEHCNAYVMPIPYADRNPDQTVAAWHCERDQFPKYVPTLDWQQVNLKAWHPDIIFYHNPYDNCNAVTSVDEQYYSRNLRYCADKLVYIPYFVLEEPCTEESVEHFVTTPGVLNADQIIVQSEAMRELYISILTKRTNQTDRAYWEERISGAGSPKIEKVLTSKKEDFDMPEEWRKLVEGRKVILYNTSLSTMLQNSDKVCEKLRYVFDVFRNRDDVVLWWRPHPLMKATFHSMRPQFEEEYLSLEKQYIEEGWGIYDDSPDLHRAICWSDAYYGDTSSVVWLYKATGKKILIQDSVFPIQGFNKGIYFIYVDILDDMAWGVSSAENFVGLFQCDFTTGNMDMLCQLKVPNLRLFEYGVLKKINNKVLIAPYYCDGCFFCYDLTERKIDSYFPPKENVFWSDQNGVPAFQNVFHWRNFIIFFGNLNNSICVYDYEKDEWNTRPYLITKDIDPTLMNFPLHSGVLIEDTVYLPSRMSNIIVAIRLDDFSIKVYKFTADINIYKLDLDDNAIWIISPDCVNQVIRFDLITRDEKVVKLPLTIQSDRRIRNIYPYRNGLLIVTIKRIVYYAGERITVLNEGYEDISWYDGIFYAKDGLIYVYESSKRVIVEVNLANLSVSWHEFEYKINRDMVGGFVYQEQYSGVMLNTLLGESKKGIETETGVKDILSLGSMIEKHLVRGGCRD